MIEAVEHDEKLCDNRLVFPPPELESRAYAYINGRRYTKLGT
jgi:hypothetical protein